MKQMPTDLYGSDDNMSSVSELSPSSRAKNKILLYIFNEARWTGLIKQVTLNTQRMTTINRHANKKNKTLNVRTYKCNIEARVRVTIVAVEKQ
jgi:hypothetical protein